jgi:hypothetical protein
MTHVAERPIIIKHLSNDHGRREALVLRTLDKAKLI